MPEEIYHLNEQGHLEPMTEEVFASEDSLQELVAKHPNLLSGERMDPSSPPRWILVAREKGIAKIVGEGHHWSLDHLFVDQNAVPTLVEAKLSRNPEIRRKIIGQMLEYAAHATKTWDVDELQRAYIERCETEGLNPIDELATLLDSDDDADAKKLWEDMGANLRAGSLRLVFVSDGIPDELARVVEFLDSQMPSTEVSAVEIKQVTSQGSRILVSRVIGRSAPEHSPKKRVRKSLKEIQESMPSDGAKAAAERLVNIAISKGCKIYPGDVGLSIRWPYPPSRSKLTTLAWLYPSFDAPVWDQARGFTFGYYTSAQEIKESPDLIKILEEWTQKFEADSSVVDASSKPPTKSPVKAWAMSPEDAAANIDTIAERFEKVLNDLNSLNW